MNPPYRRCISDRNLAGRGAFGLRCHCGFINSVMNVGGGSRVFEDEHSCLLSPEEAINLHTAIKETTGNRFPYKLRRVRGNKALLARHLLKTWEMLYKRWVMPSENKHLRGRIKVFFFFFFSFFFSPLSIDQMFSEHNHMRFQDGAPGFVFCLRKNKTTSQEGSKVWCFFSINALHVPEYKKKKEKKKNMKAES